ncbi:unnamed protein product [Cochlearia groenlandica]
MKDLKYTKTHEWARIEGSKVTFGITDYADKILGGMDSLELAKVGSSVSQGGIFGVNQSVIATIGIHSPMSGTIVEVNEDLIGSPELVNPNPYVEGWMIKVEISDASEADKLMGPEEYSKFCEEEGA